MCCGRTHVPFDAPVMQCITPVEQGWLVTYAYKSVTRSYFIVFVSHRPVPALLAAQNRYADRRDD